MFCAESSIQRMLHSIVPVLYELTVKTHIEQMVTTLFKAVSKMSSR